MCDIRRAMHLTPFGLQYPQAEVQQGNNLMPVLLNLASCRGLVRIKYGSKIKSLSVRD